MNIHRENVLLYQCYQVRNVKELRDDLRRTIKSRNEVMNRIFGLDAGTITKNHQLQLTRKIKRLSTYYLIHDIKNAREYTSFKKLIFRYIEEKVLSSQDATDILMYAYEHKRRKINLDLL